MGNPACYDRGMGDDLAKFLTDFAALAEAAQGAREARHEGEQLWDAVLSHVGVDGAALPVVNEEFGAHRLADASLLLERLASEAGGRVVGLGGEARHHMSLADMLRERRLHSFPVGEPDFASVAVGPDEQRRIVVCGLFLVHLQGRPMAALLRGASPQYGRPSGSLEIVGTEPDAVDAFTGWFRDGLRSQSIFRGHVVSFTANEYEATNAGVTFHRRPQLVAGDVVLPSGVLARVEAHVLDLGRHREELLSRGQHLKRGVLLYGPPGTGKTHTVRYLLSRSEGTTAILLSGGSLALVSEAARMARALQPAVVVLEDCDLVAEDRSFGHGPQPLLFEVLDAMDGLDRDADVAFVLTTNRVDMLERALAQRPGRVDLAVEIPRPDATARRGLLERYGRGIGFSGEALERAAEGTDGTTASFAKELVRRAVLAAAIEGVDPTDGHLLAAVGELMADGAALTRSLLGGDTPDGGGQMGHGGGDGQSVVHGRSYDAGESFGFVAGPVRFQPGGPDADEAG